MRQFVVPQFIDIESKIIGPITVRQFIIMLVAGLFIFIAFKLSDFTLFVFEAVLITVIFGVVAFVRINGQPFHYYIVNLVQYLKKAKLRVWLKKTSDKELRMYLKEKPKMEMEKESIKKAKEEVTTTRLAELSLIVNTGGVYKGE